MAALITEVAPATSKTRNRSLPARLIPAIRCFPPVDRSFGVRPAQAARWRPDSNAAGSISVASVSAVTGPTPGIVARRWLTAFALCAAVVLAREAFVREFANGKALGSYAGLTATPFSSGGTEREQGIGKAGNRRLRTVMIELAWLWQRYQPGSAQVIWFRERVGGTGKRMRKVMVVAMARRLLIALWRFATQGVVPEGAVMKPVS